MLESISSFNTKYDNIQVTLSQLEKDKTALVEENASLRTQAKMPLNDLEKYTRRDCTEIRGNPSSWGTLRERHKYSLRKHPFLLALRPWGRFARRNVCDSATEIPYWWRKICPESGQKRWLVKWMTDKRQKATKVKCKREESRAKQSIFVEYTLL